MNIYCLMTVKNEIDILPDVIDSALHWANKIIILDNNSNDGCIEYIQKISNEDERIIFWGVYKGPFTDAIRQRVFQDYKHIANVGDWWCRLDADEIYIDNPRVFLEDLNHRVDYVKCASFQYYLTEDMVTPGIDKNYKDLSHYKCNWSEIRFFKFKKDTIWLPKMNWPINIYKSADNFVRLKHFQYRNIQQIKQRIETRKNNTKDNNIFYHDKANGAEWFSIRGFKIPDDIAYLDAKVVTYSDLENSKEYIIPEHFKTKFHDKPNFLKLLQRKLVTFVFNRFFSKYI